MRQILPVLIRRDDLDDHPTGLALVETVAIMDSFWRVLPTLSATGVVPALPQRLIGSLIA